MTSNQATYLREDRRWVAWWRYALAGLVLMLLTGCTAAPPTSPNEPPTPARPTITVVVASAPSPTATTTISERTPTPTEEPMVVEPDIRLQGYGLAGPDMIWLIVNDRLIRTTDNGQHWATLYQSEFNLINRVTFVDEQHGWMAADGALKSTTDAGQHWMDQQPYTTLGYPATFSFISPQQGWVSLERRLQMTTDSGTTWREVHPNQQVWAAQFFDAQHGWGFLTNEPLVDDPMIGYTSDGGKTWLRRAAPPCRWSKGRGVFNFSGPTTAWVVCGPDNGSDVLMTALHKTEDGGQTWSQVGRLDLDAPDIFIVGVGSLLFWDDQYGLLNAAVQANDNSSARQTLIATTDSGHTWHIVANLDRQLDSLSFVSPTRGYALTDTALLGTQDGGATWAPIYSTSSP